MSDSTTFLDATGIRRDRPVLPRRHPTEDPRLSFLGLIADLGAPGTLERRGWENLIRVHGFDAVVRATARAIHAAPAGVPVRNAQTQAVLDGLRPGGYPVRHRTSTRSAARHS